MYKGTYLKIQSQADYLKKIHAQNSMQNLDLFDEPYKLALDILDCQDLSVESCAAKLGIHEATVKQVRSALNIS